MPAASFDIIVEQGADFVKTLTIKNNAGDPMDLSGYLVRSQIRKHPKSSTVIADFDVSVLIPETDGKIRWALAPAATDPIDVSTTTSFDPLEYYYDFEIESPGGVVTRILQGAALIVPNATRDTP